MEEKIGSRINLTRTDEALATGADTIAVGCPFCRVMLSDGLTTRQADGAGADVEVTGRRAAAAGGGQAAGDVSRRNRWLVAGTICVAAFGVLFAVHLGSGGSPLWVRLPLILAILGSLLWARHRDEQARAPEPLPEGPWTVRLDDPGPRKIQVIKVLREHLALSLVDAKRIVDTAPAVAVVSVSEQAARKLATELEQAQARASLLSS